MSQIVALIPARAGSKGVPNKNIRTLQGKPLLEWSIAACLKSQLIERVFVSTDSQQYADLARQLGAEAPFLRPQEIAGDSATDLEFIEHAINCLAEADINPKFLAHIRPTTPLRDPELMDQAIESFINSNGTALRSVHEMSESAYKMFEINSDHVLQKICSSDTALDSANNARQKFPPTYMPNGYIDVLSVSFIRQNGMIHGNRVLPFITPPAVEVDRQEDFELLEFQIQRSQQTFHKLFT